MYQSWQGADGRLMPYEDSPLEVSGPVSPMSLSQLLEMKVARERMVVPRNHPRTTTED